MSYFYIFFYGYLLHIVVYITVVWIDTIIYFSMKNNLKANKKKKKKTQNVVLGVCFNKKKKCSVNMTSVLSLKEIWKTTGMKRGIETVTLCYEATESTNSILQKLTSSF